MLELGGGALQLDLALEVLVARLQGALGRDAGDVNVPVEAGLGGVEPGLDLGALNVAIRLLDRRLKVDLRNLSVLLAAALGSPTVPRSWASATSIRAWLVAPSWALRESEPK